MIRWVMVPLWEMTPTGPGNPPVFHLSPPFRHKAPRVPNLDMALDVDTTALPLNLTARGVSARSDWSSAWFKFYNALPLQAYDAAQGTYAPLGEAYGSVGRLRDVDVRREQQQSGSRRRTGSPRRRHPRRR